MWIEILLGITLVLLIWIACKKPSGLPPGRWGLPLIGYFPTGGKYLDDMLADFQMQYGDIYTWRFGTVVQVFIHDYHMLQKVMASEDFINRPDMDVMKMFEQVALGVAGSNGPIWRTNRRFCLRHLQDLGLGKARLVRAVQEQAQLLVEALKKDEGKAGPFPPALNCVIINVILRMIANRHFDIDSPRHTYLQRLMDEVNSASGVMAIGDMMPWIKKVIPNFLFRRLFQVDTLMKVCEEFSQYFQEMIKEHKAELDPDDPKDLIDAYLIEINEWKEKEGDAEGIRSENDLKIILFDMFFAGSDTTYNTMKWLFLFMAAHPEVQRKLQEEIDDVLPKGTLVTLEDKTRLPYVKAVINEVLRKSTFASLGVPHAALRDTTLAGYNIPKGTVITSATVSIHLDPRYWEKPDQFLPERWLSPEGNFVMQNEGFLPFGTGKRVCIGESLARMEMLVFTAAVFQNFHIAPPEGREIDLLPDYEILMTHNPRKQDVVFTSRN